MTPDSLNEVWAMLDREHLASIVRKGPEPVFATISGAHLYGFASPDSDVDLRGAFLLTARAMLGLYPPAETITIEDKSTVDLDLRCRRRTTRAISRLSRPPPPHSTISWFGFVSRQWVQGGRDVPG